MKDKETYAIVAYEKENDIVYTDDTAYSYESAIKRAHEILNEFPEVSFVNIEAPIAVIKRTSEYTKIEYEYK